MLHSDFVPAHAKRVANEPERANDTELDQDSELAEQRAHRILCAACRAVVTQASERIEINREFSHAFVNPAGVVFRIGCFRTASGAVSIGEPSDYWTWFPGYAWRAAICRACFTHLGWLFSGESSVFWGLILNTLIEEPPNA